MKKYALMAKCLSRRTIRSYEIQVGRLQEHIRPPSALPQHNNRTKLQTCNDTSESKCPPPPPVSTR